MLQFNHVLQLLEKIVKYAIHTDNGNLDPKLVQNIRIIQKSWLLNTSKLLKKLGQPVSKLSLTEENSLSRNEVVKKNGKPLHRFIQTFTTSNGVIESAIPFKLTLTIGFFWEENYETLVDRLTRLGDNLCQLEITYPMDGGTMPMFFPCQWNLPSLTHLSFQFSNDKLLNPPVNDEIPLGNNIFGMSLLQSIFNAADNLKKFEHPFVPHQVVPQSFDFLRFPENILYLHLILKLRSNDLKVLLKNKLSNLKD